MTSEEIKYNNDIDRGQVEQRHRKRSSTTTTSTEVKFIKSIEMIDNTIEKKNVTTTSIENKEFKDNIGNQKP